MRSGIGMMAFAGAASAVLVMGAAPAVAQTGDAGGDGTGFQPSPGDHVQPEVESEAGETVPCSTEFGGDDWDYECGRVPEDGDPGGVSGWASFSSPDSDEGGRIEFAAYGEKITLNSNMPGPVEFEVWTKPNEDWERQYRYVEQDGVVSGKEESLDLPEDLTLWVGVRSTDHNGGATLGTLVS